jgi:DNA-directed RNA polymerase subunit omega
MAYNNNDGMRYPSIDQLVAITNSKYKLVVGTAKRARKINKEGNILISNPRNKKAIGIALEEVLAGKVVICDTKDLPVPEVLLPESPEDFEVPGVSESEDENL